MCLENRKSLEEIDIIRRIELILDNKNYSTERKVIEISIIMKTSWLFTHNNNTPIEINNGTLSLHS